MANGKILTRRTFRSRVTRHWQLYLILLLPIAYLVIFEYLPMYGIVLAFKRFSISKGILGSPWIGFSMFKQFFSSPSSVKIIFNTLYISIYSIVAGFPIPIILAVALNETRSRYFKKTVQMVTYAPYFISTVVMVGLIMQVTDMRLGILNKIITLLGFKAVNFLGNTDYFASVYVWSGIWQGAGYDAVIYLAALSGVSKELQEAAIVDGASKLKRIWHVDLSSIRPTIMILFVLSIGSVMYIGFEKIFLMQNTMNASASEVIATFVYKVGLVNADYSFSTAVGLFNSVVNFLLLILANFISKKVTGTGVW